MELFAKLPDGMFESETVTIAAPDAFTTEEELRARGFHPYAPAERPAGELPRGQVWWPAYRLADDAVGQYWFAKAVAPTPRTISKMKIVGALVQAEAWAQVKAWMEAQGVYDIFLAANVLEEGEAFFSQGLAALKAQLGWTDEQVEALLEQCVADGD